MFVCLCFSGLLLLVDLMLNVLFVLFWFEVWFGFVEFDFDGSGCDLLYFGVLNGKFYLVGFLLVVVGEVVGVMLLIIDIFMMCGKVFKEGVIWSVDID